MVKDPGAAIRPHRLRPLAEPQPLVVKMDADGLLASVLFEGATRDVIAVQDRWRIDDEWWREMPVAQMYYQFQLDGDRTVTVYQDLLGGEWWLQRY